jgi:hypothetical protein
MAPFQRVKEKQLAPNLKALTNYLLPRREPVVVLTFPQIERMAGPLCKSAKERREWWANSITSRPHSHYWIDAHRQATPDFNAGLVRFTVGGDNPRGPNSSTRAILRRFDRE